MENYDFALSWSIKIEELFIKLLKDDCKKKKLSFLWIYNGNLKSVLEKLENQKLHIKFLLDTEASYEKVRNKWAKLCFLVKKQGGMVIDDPAAAKLAEDKSFIQPKLKKIEISTPYTIVLKNAEIKNFKLTNGQKKKLGLPFIIKPGAGYAGKGISKYATGSKKEIQRAFNFDPRGNILFQEKIFPIHFDEKEAYFRVFRVFDSIVLCWWNHRKRRYSLVTKREFKKYNLSALPKFAERIGKVTGMYFFSTEVAVDEKRGKKRFLAIDYVNDQCDLSAQSAEPTAPPDAMIVFVAKKMTDAASQLAKKKKISSKFSVWFYS